MLTNRIKHFITNFSLNRKLNREKFIKRDFTTEKIDIHYVKQPKGGPNLLLFILIATGIYIVDNKIN